MKPLFRILLPGLRTVACAVGGRGPGAWGRAPRLAGEKKMPGRSRA